MEKQLGAVMYFWMDGLSAAQIRFGLLLEATFDLDSSTSAGKWSKIKESQDQMGHLIYNNTFSFEYVYKLHL